ncbi:copper resistance protein CopC [Planomonospora sp. ID67723]|uniref:copper resistance CopC family protein n=1 Tax=Planomonospora sp. ID67723 TaxID=2738134 RepID=UPI0018C37A7B|nr:copper resistance CopC family protein [Planomonospora sp. ID67723]MBG0829265.1 copper resistance protein CopC [Planomonospora sp. ID67723]
MKTSPFAAAFVLLAALVLGTASASPAFAHDTLKSSDPAKGEKVESLEEVKLTFTASVRFPRVVVRAGDGTPYQEGKAAADGHVVTQKVTPDLPPGKYVIAYRVVSSDGHPIEGEIPFTMAGDAPPSAAPAESGSPAQTAAPEASGTAAPSAAASITPAPAASAEDTGGGVPGWAWLAVGGLTGVGIGMFFSMRNKKQP